jgi:GTP cyclohydrolase III
LEIDLIKLNKLKEQNAQNNNEQSNLEADNNAKEPQSVQTTKIDINEIIKKATSATSNSSKETNVNEINNFAKKENTSGQPNKLPPKLPPTKPKM